MPGTTRMKLNASMLILLLVAVAGCLAPMGMPADNADCACDETGECSCLESCDCDACCDAKGNATPELEDKEHFESEDGEPVPAPTPDPLPNTDPDDQVDSGEGIYTFVVAVPPASDWGGFDGIDEGDADEGDAVEGDVVEDDAVEGDADADEGGLLDSIIEEDEAPVVTPPAKEEPAGDKKTVVNKPLAFNPFAEGWPASSEDDEVIDDILRRLDKLEDDQLTPDDVIRIVEENFTCLRIRKDGTNKSVAITTDVVEEQHRVAGFAGTFSVPKGGSVQSVDIVSGGKWVRQPVRAAAPPVRFLESSTVYRATAGNHAVYATDYQQPTGTMRVSVYNQERLAPTMQIVGKTQSSQGRQGLLKRLFSPKTSAAGSVCVQNADGSVTCNR